MLHFERIENLSSEFQNIDSVHSISKMLGPFFKGCTWHMHIGKIVFSYSRKTWQTQSFKLIQKAHFEEFQVCIAIPGLFFCLDWPFMMLSEGDRTTVDKNVDRTKFILW